MTTDLLVIGYGNELRGDDAVGPRVARAVAGQARPNVRSLAAHQLTPEMAEELSRARRAVFVDARVGGCGARVQSVAATTAAAGWGHTSDPGWLLRLTQNVYGRAPEAWLVTIGAVDLSMGEPLSPAAALGAAEALRWIEAMAGGGLCTR